MYVLGCMFVRVCIHGYRQFLCLYLCVCIYACVCMFMYVYACLYAHVCVHVPEVHIFAYVLVLVCKQVCVCVCVCGVCEIWSMVYTTKANLTETFHKQSSL